MSKITGATLIARSLKKQGIDHLFGVVGFPVGPIAAAAQEECINYSLTAPAVNPWTKWRCKETKMAIGGRLKITEAANN